MKLRDAHANNLAGIDLDLPLHTWTAVTGVSGSGKSTLVFDTLVREGRQRFLGSSSARARRALGKLGPAEVAHIEGLPVPLGIGAGRLVRSERSTVGTLSGLLDPLRLVWARQGSDGPHRRGDFSFNSAGACPTCDGRGDVADIDRALLVVHPERSIRAGALGPTLPNGYTVYSQVTVDVLDQVCRAHGFDIDTPWQDLDPAQHEVIFCGSDRLEVPFGKHSLESRLKWEGITARPREVGHYRGLLPVMRETLQRSPNPNILRYATRRTCPDCQGTRLGPVGRTTTVGRWTLVEVAATPLDRLEAVLDGLEGPVVEAVRPAMVDRIRLACTLGLGHLALERPSTTLSDGELQRTRLLAQLGLAMGGLLIAFDEPTLGLHPTAHPGLQQAIERLVALGNTVLTVDHDPAFVTAAPRRLTLGPGAGPEGGRIVHHGPTGEDPLGGTPRAGRQREVDREIVLADVRHRGLDTDLRLGRDVLNVLMGPSGAGKSTLLFDSLVPALEGDEGAYGAVTGADGLAVETVDATPIGRTPRSTVATYTGLLDVLRKVFAATPDAKARNLRATHFSHNTRAGRCPDCEGRGVQRIGLHLMTDVERPCPTCDGQRYREEVLGVLWEGRTIASLLALSVDEARTVLGDVPRAAELVEALASLGLGHLALGRSSTTLSRGEAQRVKLAVALAARGERRLLLLDEPDRGLHPVDLARLLAGLQGLVDAGHTVVCISHRPALWHAADRLLEVSDGRCRVADPPVVEARRPSMVVGQAPAHIALTGVRTNTLRDVDVAFPHGKLTVVCGPSGSGKSSLVFDTLVAEADRRFGETLPFEVRRHLRRLPAPELDDASGLTPTVALRQDAGPPGSRSTLATTSGLGPWLRLLYAREGRLDGRPCGLTASHFARSEAVGRCAVCEGERTVRVVSVDRLVTHPDRSLRAGTLAGTRPGRFFGEPDGRHLAVLGASVDLDTPWTDLSDADRARALHGDPTVRTVTWSFVRGRRRGEHVLEEAWPGFVPLVEAEARKRAGRKDAADWWTPFDTVACEACAGTGLASPARDVRWNGRTLAELGALPLGQLAEVLDGPTDLAPLVDRCRALVADLRVLGVTAPVDTPLGALDPGMRQRIRLAGLSTSGLTGLTVVLDEPDAGLPAGEHAALVAHLRGLVDAGHTVIAVSHASALLRAADHLIELGPGAGAAGGRVVGTGPAVRDGEGPTARALRNGLPALPARLEQVDRPMLLALAAEQDLTTRSQASTLAYALDWMKPLQKRFAAAGPLKPAAFSHHSASGRCPVCKGSGAERIALDALADLSLPCPACDGARYRPEVLAVQVDGRSVADVLAAPVSALANVVPALADRVATAGSLGLGHLPVGAPLRTLSGGERQRVDLLAAVTSPPSVLLLDDPLRGLHPVDVPPVLEVLDALPATTRILAYLPTYGP
jgi:excinuclease ABC subunit A